MGTKPALLTAAREGGADDLKKIKGVGKVLEGKLNDNGIYHYDQIANWSRDEVNWITTFLNFKGRIDREEWIPQAQGLMAQAAPDAAPQKDPEPAPEAAPKAAKAEPEGDASDAPAPAPKKTQTKTTPKKSPAAKAPAEKPAAAKATPAKAPASKAPAKKPAATKAPAKPDPAQEEARIAAALAALPADASNEDKANAAGKKPRTLKQPRKAGADDLKRIKGVGKVIEGKLNDLGIYHFDQIGKWNRDHINWMDNFLSFKGRIDRDDWIEQCKMLAIGEDTDFSKRVDKGEVESSQ